MKNVMLFVLAALVFMIQRTTAQGAGGGCGGVGCGYYGSYHAYNRYDVDRRDGDTSGSILNIALGILVSLAIGCPIIYCIYRYKKNRKDEKYTEPPTATEWLRSNENVVIDIGDTEQQNEGGIDSVFMSGKYVGHYIQYSKKQSFPMFALNFENGNVSGRGYDKVGSYYIAGRYNEGHNRLAMTKTYIRGTGNPYQNFGHNVDLRLQWNEKAKQFEGKWYVKTNSYRGTGMWYLYQLNRVLNQI